MKVNVVPLTVNAVDTTPSTATFNKDASETFALNVILASPSPVPLYKIVPPAAVAVLAPVSARTTFKLFPYCKKLAEVNQVSKFELFG